jgi:CRISPR-associated protein Cas5t
MKTKALCIKIFQPTAHYRMPFTYQRRHTYPLPPYSTVLGMIINLLGITNQNDSLFTELRKCKLAVSGHFDTKHTEYIWYRNLNAKSHKKYFNSTTIREKNGEIEHIGGQSPMRIDVLENMNVTIYLYTENEDFLNLLHDTFLEPVNRREIIHLGRAEDWIVFKSIDFVELIKAKFHKNFNEFFWIPKDIWLPNDINDKYDFNNIEGLLYNLTVFATIKDYDKTYDRNAMRSFDYLRVKLNDGAIKNVSYLTDGNLPVFFARLDKAK